MTRRAALAGIKEGATASASTPDAFAEKVRNELARWTRLIKDASIATE